ncbi:MAG TPA: YciI family protein [Bacillota bacterium]
MNQWIYVLRPVRAGLAITPTAEEDAAVERHFARLQSLLAAGRLIVAGRTLEDSPFGIVIFEAGTEAEARSIMETDPAVQEGVMTAVLHPYRVALRRDG